MTPSKLSDNKGLRSYFASNSIENNLIILVCVIALFRVVLGGIADWIIISSTTLLLRNIVFGFMFSILLLLSVRHKDKEWVKGVFGAALIVLLIANFVESRGLQGMGKFNALGSLLILTVIYRSILIYIVPTIYLVLLSVLLFQPQAFDWIGIPIGQTVNETTGFINFWVNALGITFVAYYIKKEYDRKQKMLAENKLSLNERNELLNRQHEELKENKMKLQIINERLNTRIDERTRELKERNKAVKSYIELNTKEILIPLKDTINEIGGVKLPDDPSEEDLKLVSLLKASGKELDDIYETIKENLIKDGKISRNDIS